MTKKGPGKRIGGNKSATGEPLFSSSTMERRQPIPSTSLFKIQVAIKPNVSETLRRGSGSRTVEEHHINRKKDNIQKSGTKFC